MIDPNEAAAFGNLEVLTITERNKTHLAPSSSDTTVNGNPETAVETSEDGKWTS